MLPYRDSRLTQIALGLFFLTVGGYAYFEARGLVYGPHIDVSTNVSTVSEQYVLISGHTDHIASLSVNGVPVAVTTDGIFGIPYLLALGLNRIVLDANDNYGNTTSKTVEIVYIPTSSPAPTPAMQSPTTTPDAEPATQSTTNIPLDATTTSSSPEPTFATSSASALPRRDESATSSSIAPSQ